MRPTLAASVSFTGITRRQQAGLEELSYAPRTLRERRAEFVDPITEVSSAGRTAALDRSAGQGASAGTRAAGADLVPARFWRRAAAAAVDTALLTVELALLIVVVFVVTVFVATIAA